MADNVIIFGAGASYDAGIPLLSGFFEQMIHFAAKPESNGQPFPDADKELFKEVLNVRDYLDNYHGRANFDPCNIEDILSILSFGAMCDDEDAEYYLAIMTKAIARTIEYKDILTANPPSIGKPNGLRYRKFWEAIFDSHKKKKQLPAIISFNYDLVLERALESYNKILAREAFFLPNSFSLNYAYSEDSRISLIHDVWQTHVYASPSTRLESFHSLTPNAPVDVHAPTVDLLKLHGSLNFPKKTGKWEQEKYCVADDDPLILPPIFNKLGNNTKNIAGVWKKANEHLREAKHVIIVGYSLPATDIYMQYFLKSALGPNTSLEHIYVFDPVLFTGSKQASESMEERYSLCFSEQLRRKITFQPKVPEEQLYTVNNKQHGTFRHFVDVMGTVLFAL